MGFGGPVCLGPWTTRREATETLISGGREAGVADSAFTTLSSYLAGTHQTRRSMVVNRTGTNTLSHETCGPKREATRARAGLSGLYQVTVSLLRRPSDACATTPPHRPTANGNAWKQAADSPPLLCLSRAPPRPLSRVPQDLNLRIT